METLAYIAANSSLLKWTLANGVEELNRGWGELGTLIVDASGNILVTDRNGDGVFLVTPDGSPTRFAGNGTTAPIIDGTPALEVGLYCVRGIWPFPTGGYLYAMECGSQIAYQDADGYVYVLVDGQQGNIHLGDGEWFYTPGPKVSNCRSVTMDYRGNILITENDAGYVRRVRFQRLQP
jgi:DNA-binding beta-propeller fold protein YncE